jgi:hypothetical protein
MDVQSQFFVVFQLFPSNPELCLSIIVAVNTWEGQGSNIPTNAGTTGFHGTHSIET